MTATANDLWLRAVAEAALDGIGALRGRRFLHVGCGSGLLLRLATERGAAVWGVDSSIARLEQARLRVPEADLRVGDVDELPFDTGTFDVVFSRDCESTIGELVRVCRPGGLIAVFAATLLVAEKPQLR